MLDQSFFSRSSSSVMMKARRELVLANCLVGHFTSFFLVARCTSGGQVQRTLCSVYLCHCSH